MKRFWLSVVLLFIIAQPSRACECGGRPTAASALRDATAVFEGRVVGIRMTIASEHGWLFPVPLYDFEVTRSWKGLRSRTVTLVSIYSNCATVFARGKTYLVFAGPHPNVVDSLSSSKCAPTVLSNYASADIVAIGAPTRTFAVASGHLESAMAIRFRAYLVGGTAAYGNLVRHATDADVWKNFGVYPLTSLGVACACAMAGIALRSSRRRAVAMFGLALLFALSSLFSAGEILFQSTWLAQYLIT
ncbi:MAG TPA: hypothetical protein VII75_13335 [Thermoanaerobaculia bacterium]